MYSIINSTKINYCSWLSIEWYVKLKYFIHRILMEPPSIVHHYLDILLNNILLNDDTVEFHTLAAVNILTLYFSMNYRY